MCPSQCAIRVHRRDGVVSMIEGNPKSPLGMGRLCAGGPAGIQLLYDPYRVNHPLKRTNPEKGIGVDPRWQEIGWDEALSIIVEKLKKVRAEDPRKLFPCRTPASPSALAFALGVFVPAFWQPQWLHLRRRPPGQGSARAGAQTPGLWRGLLAFVGLSSLAGDFFVHYCVVKAGIYLPIVGELPPARSYRGRPRLF
jgi:anaerobic selenocysteine-containing dehydrogenase